MDLHTAFVVAGSAGNFFALLWILNKFAIPKLKEGITSKQESIIQSIDDTEKALAEVNSKLEKQRQLLKEVQDEIQSIRDNAEKVGVSTSDKIRENAKKEAEQWHTRVDSQIEQELNLLKNDIREDFINQVIDAVELKISKQLGKKTQNELIKGFAKELKEYQSA